MCKWIESIETSNDDEFFKTSFHKLQCPLNILMLVVIIVNFNFLTNKANFVCRNFDLIKIRSMFFYICISIWLSKVIPHTNFHDKFPSSSFQLSPLAVGFYFPYFIIYFLRCKLNKNWFFFTICISVCMLYVFLCCLCFRQIELTWKWVNFI